MLGNHEQHNGRRFDRLFSAAARLTADRTGSTGKVPQLAAVSGRCEWPAEFGTPFAVLRAR